jgi:hypothetical protein
MRVPVFARPLLATLVVSLLVAGTLAAATQPASSVQCEYWGDQPLNPGSGDNELFGVETASPCLTWVVGYSTDAETGRRQTLIQRWDTDRWLPEKIFNSGNVTTGAIAGGTLHDLAAYSTNNAWAVGHFSLPGQPPAGLFVRWDGKRWLRYQTPLDDPIWESEILGVAAASKNSFWAVGRSFDNSEEEYRAVIFHWNGKKWARAPIELPESLEGIDVSLNAVADSPSGPPYAVGSYAGIGSRRQTLIFRWNTRVWKRVQTPNVKNSHNVLTGISALGSYVWASGYTQSADDPDKGRPLVLRLSGSQWKQADMNVAGSDMQPLSDVVVIPGGSWAAGYQTCKAVCDPDTVTPLILSWNDRRKNWSPNSRLEIGTDNRLHAIDASSNKNVWVVGSYREEPGGPLRTYAFAGGNCC